MQARRPIIDVRYPLAVLATAALSLAAGCVTKARYDAAALDAHDTHAALDESNRQNEARDARIAELGKQIGDLEKRLQDQAERTSEATVTGHNLQASLDEQTAINEQLRRELSRLGRNVEELLSERGGLSQSLEKAKARLEELRRTEAQAEARAAFAQELAHALDKNIAAHELALSFTSGRLFVTIQADAIFEPGRPRLLQSARPQIKHLAEVLRGFGGRHFEVGVHTDVAPKGRSGATWELSSTRAVELVEALIAGGMAADSLSTAGYAEFAPLDRSGTTEARARNQRVEITLVPKADEPLGATPTPPPGRTAAATSPTVSAAAATSPTVSGPTGPGPRPASAAKPPPSPSLSPTPPAKVHR